MKSYIKYQKNQNILTLFLQNNWDMNSIKSINKELRNIPSAKEYVIDASNIKNYDSAGIIEIIKIYKKLSKRAKVKIVGLNNKQEELFKLLKDTIGEKIEYSYKSFLYDLGKAAIDLLKDIKAFLEFLGQFSIYFLMLFIKPKNFRIKETIYHIYQSGFGAIIIIALTTFLVGVVIAYQSAVQLAKFGADIFIVDTIGISITRELSPMIVAIVIAGRSASSYTAEIGAMKLTEEISAMKTMGFEPFYFLVIPRVVALIISLPLLIVLGDIIGIYGGAIIAKLQLNISFYQFIQRLNEVLAFKHYYLGLIKGPVFAFLIATIGCFRGFLVSNNTESIGLQTTASVVNSIFLVIAFDALFSVIYTELGL
jgi:phospholipid/cholesterol/gamma-HCH transport system permease protein